MWLSLCCVENLTLKFFRLLMTRQVVGSARDSTACRGVKRNAACALLASVQQGGFPLSDGPDSSVFVVFKACLKDGEAQEAIHHILRSSSRHSPAVFDIASLSLSNVSSERKKIPAYSLPTDPVEEPFWMPDVSAEQVAGLTNTELVLMRSLMPDFNIAEYLDYQDIVDVLPPNSYLVVYRQTGDNTCIYCTTKSNMKGTIHQEGELEWKEADSMPDKLIVLMEHADRTFTPMVLHDDYPNGYQGAVGDLNRYGPDSLSEAIVDILRYQGCDFGEADRVSQVNRLRLALAKKVSEKSTPSPATIQKWRQDLAEFLGTFKDVRKTKVAKLLGITSFKMTRPGFENRRFSGIPLDELKFSAMPPVSPANHAGAVDHYQNLNRMIRNRKDAVDRQARAYWQKELAETVKRYASEWVKLFFRSS
eukprot:Protomagalhaensia_sp_Gyna_25__3784@NODE_33_length_6954_cov_98_369776_g23_i0_p2_GENE_NODE_33_length_6954_cov_98_369776_g23_i0NODE_33_length_6954_cov_98_369776_g23_i0_p2_ORF_typecomplete_len420_score44_98_NODE_33_length_6954_cov_98_369776_g23_i013682627